MSDYDADVNVTSTRACECCGKPVFQRTEKIKRFCSRACNKRYWKRTHPSRPKMRSWTSGTITVLYADNGLRSFVGYGLSPGEAHEHAREQAQKLGAFTEVGYVTVWKINSELQRQSA